MVTHISEGIYLNMKTPRFSSLWFFEDFDGHLPLIPVTDSTFWTIWPRFDQSGLDKGYSRLRSKSKLLILQISLLRETRNRTSYILYRKWVFRRYIGSEVFKIGYFYHQLFLNYKKFMSYLGLKDWKIRSMKYGQIILWQKGYFW